ncbi:MAG TPA: hypothetical protein VFP17_09570 [Solirubrobacterales bacterium]|nr:hypothetical protein [Solirubrobacterales bacterium]
MGLGEAGGAGEVIDLQRLRVAGVGKVLCLEQMAGGRGERDCRSLGAEDVLNIQVFRHRSSRELKGWPSRFVNDWSDGEMLLMMGFRTKLSYANVIATLALFLALGGGAYAATQLPKNSVGSKQLKKGAVTPAKLNGAAKATLTGPVGPAGPQGPAGASGATHVVVRVAPGYTEGESTVSCNPGEVATGGGGETETKEQLLWGSFPTLSNGKTAEAGQTPMGWGVGGETAAGLDVPVKAFVVCVSP